MSLSSNGGGLPLPGAVVVTHTSTLVADVLARALTLAGLPCRVGSTTEPREVLVGNIIGADVELGRDGGLGPDHHIEQLVVAVRDRQAGRPAVVPTSPAPASPVLPALTDREREVLRLLTVGASNEAMAEALAISPHTVRTHVQNLLGKLGVQNRLAAAAVARRSGLLAVGA